MIQIVPVSSGSFVHDVSISFPGGEEWIPTKEELVVMGAAMHKLAEKAVPIERLDVGRQVMWWVAWTRGFTQPRLRG